MTKYTGGCACGAIKYTMQSEPEFSFHCQCRQCQRITGTGHASQFVLRADSVQIDGEIKYFDLTADSGNAKSSGFCPNCGTPILTMNTGNPELRFFHAATLDDPARFRPQKVLYHSSSQPWDFADPGLEVF